jgi:hypothetical protein
MRMARAHACGRQSWQFKVARRCNASASSFPQLSHTSGSRRTATVQSSRSWAFKPEDCKNSSKSSTRVGSLTWISIYRSRAPRVAARQARTSQSRQKPSAVNGATRNSRPSADSPGRVASVEDQGVAIGISERREVADTGIPGLRDELDPLRFEFSSRRGNVSYSQCKSGFVCNERQVLAFWLPEAERHVRRLNLALCRITVG